MTEPTTAADETPEQFWRSVGKWAVERGYWKPDAEARQQDASALRLIERAEQAVGDLCAGRLRWEMRVPAEPDHDPDLIISTALRAARTALAALPPSAPPEFDEPEAVWAHVVLDPESHEPTLLSGNEFRAVNEAMGDMTAGRFLSRAWIRPGPIIPAGRLYPPTTSFQARGMQPAIPPEQDR